MLNKKSIKIIAIVILAVLMLTAMSTSCFAASISEKFVPKDPSGDGAAAVNNIAGTVLGYIKYIGVAIAVGMMIYLGIKYVTSSPDGKADLKGKLGVYVLGLVLILAATTIVGIIENGINSATGSSNSAGFAISTLLMH